MEEFQQEEADQILMVGNGIHGWPQVSHWDWVKGSSAVFGQSPGTEISSRCKTVFVSNPETLMEELYACYSYASTGTPRTVGPSAGLKGRGFQEFERLVCAYISRDSGLTMDWSSWLSNPRSAKIRN